MIILIGVEKGGTGKSTIATNLSVLCAQNNKDVLLIDCDDNGASTFYLHLKVCIVF